MGFRLELSLARLLCTLHRLCITTGTDIDIIIIAATIESSLLVHPVKPARLSEPEDTD
jgi:hypothetical protein